MIYTSSDSRQAAVIHNEGPELACFHLLVWKLKLTPPNFPTAMIILLLNDSCYNLQESISAARDIVAILQCVMLAGWGVFFIYSCDTSWMLWMIKGKSNGLHPFLFNWVCKIHVKLLRVLWDRRFHFFLFFSSNEPFMHAVRSFGLIQPVSTSYSAFSLLKPHPNQDIFVCNWVLKV